MRSKEARLLSPPMHRAFLRTMVKRPKDEGAPLIHEGAPLMFGIAVAQLDQVSAAEKERYQALYCGLCRTLKERYGQVSRAVLSYDLTFYLMLANSLFEPPEVSGSAPCITHPAKQMPYILCHATPYAADLSVALAYHKCLDDIQDESSLAARAARVALQSSYERAQEHIPRECQSLEEAMARIRQIEADPTSGPDDGANVFGSLLGMLFAHDAGFWTPALNRAGNALGRLIYLMDAAVDLPEDEKRGAYNPFAPFSFTPDELRCLLMAVAADAAEAFDALPLERDAHLLESVLYGGIWQSFNKVYSDA